MKIRKVEPKNWIFPSDSINLKLVFPKATFTLDKDWFRVKQPKKGTKKNLNCILQISSLKHVEALV